MMLVLLVAAAVGFAARLAWGTAVGVGVGVLLLLVGAVLLVLRRNRADLEALERGRLAEEIADVLGDEEGGDGRPERRAPR